MQPRAGRASDAAAGLQPVGPVGDGLWGHGRGVVRWTIAFMLLGITLRLVRFGRKHPLWRDEAYRAVNLPERDFAGLAAPLDYQQVCSIHLLGAEKRMIEVCGFGEWSLRLIPTVASIASLFVLHRVAGMMVGPAARLFAVAVLAVATPRFALAAEWLLALSRVRPLWWLLPLGRVD